MNQRHGESGSSPFDDSSRQYLESAVFTGGSDLETIAEWLGACRSVLDVGSGTLHTAGALEKHGIARVVGVDPSLAMLREGRTLYESIPAVAGRSEALPFGANSFEGIVCRYAAHHFGDQQTFLDEARRVLVASGQLVVQDIVVPARDELGQKINRIAELRDPSHERYYSVEEWEQRLEDSEWSLRATETFRLTLDYGDWLDRMDPPEESRRRIAKHFGELTGEERRRLNLTESQGQPETFEYPVAVFRCQV